MGLHRQPSRQARYIRRRFPFTAGAAAAPASLLAHGMRPRCRRLPARQGRLAAVNHQRRPLAIGSRPARNSLSLPANYHLRNATVRR